MRLPTFVTAALALLATPALAQTTPLSPNAADLKQACQAEAETAVTAAAAKPGGPSRDTLMREVDGAYEKIAATPREEAASDLAQVKASQSEPALAPLRALLVCVLQRRANQP